MAYYTKFQDRLELLDEPFPTCSFDDYDDLEPERIDGATQHNGQLILLVKWKDVDFRDFGKNNK